jgi:hypothetical protein
VRVHGLHELSEAVFDRSIASFHSWGWAARVHSRAAFSLTPTNL